MSSSNTQSPIDPVEDILACLRQKGVRLWTEGGQLRYRAPRGTLNPDEIRTLQTHKAGLVAHFSAAAPSQRDVAPLSFSQLAHWNRYRLWERPAIRQIPAAIRLRGGLHVPILRESLEKIVARHGALRTRIVIRENTPWQEISPSASVDLVIQDLTTRTAGPPDHLVSRAIEHLILEPVDISVGPLFAARLLKLGEQEHVLLLAMEHIISDAFSMAILLEELFETYAKSVLGETDVLPDPPLQFADYAVQQRQTHESWLARHGSYWDQRRRDWQHVRFPHDPAWKPHDASGWGSVPVHIDKATRQELVWWCRSRRTTLVMAVFAAYAAAVLHWCDVSQYVLQYVTDGRNQKGTERAIGFFASTLCVRAQRLETDRFDDFLHRLTDEYCQAMIHDDSFFMESQVPAPAFTLNAAFNWIPQSSKNDRLSCLNGSACQLTSEVIPFEHPLLERLERDAEPVLVLYDNEEETNGTLLFPRNRFSTAQMQRFSRDILLFLQAALRASPTRMWDPSMVS